jgi:surface carbohydrate biosynthesis protein
MKIALILDNPYRDLPGMTLVAERLAGYGHRVYLVPFNMAPTELGALAPDFVVLPHLKKTHREIALGMLDMGFGLGILDTEGGPYKSLEYYEQLLTDDADLRSKISVVCAWGPLRHDYSIRRGLFRKEQMRITGSARHDYFHPRWKDAALKYSEGFVTTPDPFFLIATNFTYANPRYQTKERELEMAMRDLGISEAEAHAYVTDQQALLEGFIDFAQGMAEAAPGATTVFRPHPFEALETYEKEFTRHKNLVMKLEGSVEGWVMRARALVQRDSTVAIDAALAGTPVLTPAWLKASFGVPEIEKVSDPCASRDELLEKLRAVLDGTYTAPEALQEGFRQVKDDYYFQLDGESNVRAAAAIHEAASAWGSHPDIRRCQEILFNWRGWDHPRTSLKDKLRMKALMWAKMSPGISLKTGVDPTQKERVDKWDATGKRYSLQDVQPIAKILHATDPTLTTHWRRASYEEGDYYPKGFEGRSLCVLPPSRSE